jgi:5'-3' exonuclease
MPSAPALVCEARRMVGSALEVHLVDGTYELFRHHFGAPSHLDPDGIEVAAARGVLGTVLMMLEQGATHVGVATDHVIESFRNDLFAGYKTGDGMPPDLWAQFPLAEDALRALGVTVWPMIAFEADDALATAAHRFAGEVEQVVILSPDKDMAQCVTGDRVIMYDRIRKKQYDEAGVRGKFGVAPGSIPDYLALVGDNADGLPGVIGWGPKSASTMLAQFGSIEAFPNDVELWPAGLRQRLRLSESLRAAADAVQLYKKLATLRRDVPLSEGLSDLEWAGARPKDYTNFCHDLGLTSLIDRPKRWKTP